MATIAKSGGTSGHNQKTYLLRSKRLKRIPTRLERWNFALHLFVGFWGLAGGYAAIAAPDNPVGISTDILEGSPFVNFLIPGLFLFIVIGLGNVFAAWPYWKNWQIGPYATSLLGVIMILWVVIQAIIIGWLPLHYIFLVVGSVQLFLGLRAVARDGNFPF